MTVHISDECKTEGLNIQPPNLLCFVLPFCNLHYEKFADGTVKCIEDEIPFDLPKRWEWARINTFCILNPKNMIPDDTTASFVPMSLIKEGYANEHSFEEREWSSIKSGFTHFANNDIAIAKITPCFENRKSVVFKNLSHGVGAGTTELFVIRCISDAVLSEYLLWNFKTKRFIDGGVQTYAGDVGQQRVRRDYISKYLIAIPPQAEQKHIVDAINLLFELISSIDSSYKEMSDLVLKAKSKILDLAIRGKLVPQDPNDEPASVLLERIRAEKKELIRQGKIKRDKKDSVIFKGEDNSYYRNYENESVCIDENIPFEIPSNWEWCNLSMIGSTNIGLTYKPEDIIENGTMVLRSSNIVNGKIDLSDLVRVKTSIRDNQYIEENDILICARNGSKALVGKCAIFSGISERASFGAFMAVYRTAFFKYVYYFLNSNTFRSTFNSDDTKQINQLTQDMIKNSLIPLPPFEEQLRIVETIENVFAQLETIAESLN